jgi:hypothetical protein
MIELGPTRHRRYVLYTALTLILVPLAGFWLYLRLFSGQLLEYKVSPDGKYVAEYRSYYQGGGATTTNLKGVEIRTKLNPFRHTIIDALDYGADLSIRWIDSRNLLVTWRVAQTTSRVLSFWKTDPRAQTAMSERLAVTRRVPRPRFLRVGLGFSFLVPCALFRSVTKPHQWQSIPDHRVRASSCTKRVRARLDLNKSSRR